MKRRVVKLTSCTIIGLMASCFSVAQAQESALAEFSQPQIIEVAEKREFLGNIADDSSASLSARGLDASDRKRIKIHRPGAGFIKVHFSDFNIPEGSRVIVRDPSGEQRYVYKNNSDTPRTLDQEAGDDGVKSFGAMSIQGDTALVIYRANGRDAPYSIDIDYIMEGYSNDMIEAAMDQATISEEGAVSAFSTCGVNERRDVQCWKNSHPTEFERTRPVARLLINGSGLCTAWRVGPNNRMFTNNHCFSTQSAAQNTEVWFNYQRSACGSGNTSGTVKVSARNLLKTNFNLDYTLFDVNNFNSITQFGNFGIETRDANNQERIYIPQHGSGNPKELAINSDQDQGGVCRVNQRIVNGRANSTDMSYFCDTIGGSSGSPVLAASSNKVIALHHFGVCPNRGVRMAAIWPQVAEFFNGVPAGDNNSGGGGVDPRSGRITDISVGAKQWRRWTLNVLPGTKNIRFALSGGRGDADLYLRSGAQTTLADFQCRSWNSNNTELCEVNNPREGSWSIGVFGYEASSGVTMDWSYR